MGQAVIIVGGEKTPLRTLPHVYAEEAEPIGFARAVDTLVPPSTVYSVERNDNGAVVFAVQDGLNQVRQNKIEPDWSYGAETEDAVWGWQDNRGLTVDGVFGPSSSEELALQLVQKVPKSRSGLALPGGLLRGLVFGESGALIGAINNSVVGGRDVSYTQRRVLDENYSNRDVVRQAFRPKWQMQLFADRLRERHDTYFAIPDSGSHERCWRLGTLYHNYPYAAGEYAKGNWPSSYALSPQAWVMAIGAKFPDGVPVRTPHEWCGHYSLGFAAHNDPGMMTQFVNTWPS